MITAIKRAGYVLAALWIFGGAIIYYWRFTVLFVDDHGAAISALFGRIREWFAGIF